MEKYSKEFSIPYYDCNKDGFIKAISILEYLVETSSVHSDYLGLGFKELINNNFGWILSRWKVNIYKYPKALEKIEVKTWISGFNKFYANREFSIYNKNKELLLKASALWIFVDTKRKRPIRIPSNFYNNYDIIGDKNFDGFFQFNNSFKVDLSIDFRVRKNDIDYNEHVNNTKYLNWFLELIPLDIDEDYILQEIDIYYKKEIKYNSIIESKISKKNESEKQIEYFHEIYNKNTRELATNARTVWIKKDYN